MRRARSSLEDQVGGLVDDAHRRTHGRAALAAAPEAVEPRRYPSAPEGTVAIRADRADGRATGRRVA
ncbi:MAG: hypothetical protein Q8K58_11015 [Acidimicrobiales bacterium]|nr:hypothetical protein [Acidimicrobiales bacterium]